MMGSVFTSSAVDRGFEPRSGETKDLNFRSKSKNWLTRNQDIVSEWNDMSTRGMLLHRVGLLQSKHHLIEYNLLLPWYG